MEEKMNFSKKKKKKKFSINIVSNFFFFFSCDSDCFFRSLKNQKKEQNHLNKNISALRLLFQNPDLSFIIPK